MQFRTRYGGPLNRILQAYAPGSPALVSALEAICSEAEKIGRKNAMRDMAAEVCEGIHPHASSGVKCLDCYYAEVRYEGAKAVEAEFAAAAKKAAGGEPPVEDVVAAPQADPEDDIIRDALRELGVE